MIHSPTLLLAACVVVSAAQLWLAAELGRHAATRGDPLGGLLLATSVMLGTCALWWPTSALRPPDHAGASGWMPGWEDGLRAALVSTLAVAVGRFGRPGRRPVVALVATLVATSLLTAATTFAFPPDALEVGAAGPVGQAAGGWFRVGAAPATVAALLLGRWPWPEVGLGGAVRVVTSLVAATAVGMGVAGWNRVAIAHWPAGPEWLVMGLLVLLGAVLLVAVRQGGRPTFRLSAAASVDHLIGLPTRLFFEARLAAAASRSQSVSGRLMVFFIDLDGFKPVNDSLGHRSGDQVLEQVGQRLKKIARGQRVAARIGADQFLLLAPEVAEAGAAADLARSLIDALGQPCRLDTGEVTVSCSVGIAHYAGHGDPTRLIARADAAMHAAKRAGGGRYGFYAPEMDAGARHDFDMLRDLRQALAHGEFELFFQPKIDARSGQVTAAEALLRWNHTTRGLVLPGAFIALAERSGLIGPIGNWVIEAACKQARAWKDQGLRMRVAINLSAQQMRQDDIADRLAQALSRHRIHPALMTCEITESAAMEDTGATQDTFRRLGEMGTHLSIDDFGTGYSSLGYLRQLPAEELKIDASFVKDVDHSADARAVIDAVVKLAHALGLKVVAEGVETQRQQKVLEELGCDELQGFLFARPMSAGALLLWAMQDRSGTAMFRESLFVDPRSAFNPSSRGTV